MLGCPSAELSKSIVSGEKERVEKQAKELGEEGLKKREEELKTAIAQNEVRNNLCIETSLLGGGGGCRGG